MRKIQFTVLLSILCLIAFAQKGGTNDDCFKPCLGIYKTVIGQNNTNLTIQFEDIWGNQVYPESASFTIRMENKNGGYKNFKVTNEDNPTNTVTTSKCGKGWYDVTIDGSGSLGGLSIVSIEMCPMIANLYPEIKKWNDEECDANDYLVEIRDVILYFSKSSSCSSNADYCYCISNKLDLVGNNSISVYQSHTENLLNINVNEDILLNNENIKLIIYDANGKPIRTIQVDHIENKINATVLNGGFYFIVIKNNERLLTTKKVIIN